MINKDLIRGTLQPIILSVLSQGERFYGYELSKLVAEKSEEQIKLTDGALYPTLHKLEKEGLVQTEKVEVGSRIRKYYRLTTKGQKESAKRVAELLSFVKSIELVVRPKSLSYGIE